MSEVAQMALLTSNVAVRERHSHSPLLYAERERIVDALPSEELQVVYRCVELAEPDGLTPRELLEMMFLGSGRCGTSAAIRRMLPDLEERGLVRTVEMADWETRYRIVKQDEKPNPEAWEARTVPPPACSGRANQDHNERERHDG